MSVLKSQRTAAIKAAIYYNGGSDNFNGDYDGSANFSANGIAS